MAGSASRVRERDVLLVARLRPAKSVAANFLSAPPPDLLVARSCASK